MAKKDKSYTEAIQELQEILDKLESGDMEVDVLTEEIKKASVLLKLCKEKLYKTDTEIKKILDNLD
ncbi:MULTISPECIES: exodeoxyribonuclease VII small subunit [unclassified Dysgonomonas]|uniref:exodeoxyribonuclease VII small subunit n=1 Tax=unclassified Dysgonomonas TaxID=2630389 RepID=UPI000682AA72|nr:MULTISPECIES: exodeoxyribonuclease VII small subunit [unclassified Dysgonomonas]MBD8349036.1 exodeoxyribonuclease VII small subunit [Dysgonomonas sp. HGC4]MBF0576497.1 exodeoxyribonuclease VII small subunit [Dysgonomonas sp. GY617]